MAKRYDRQITVRVWNESGISVGHSAVTLGGTACKLAGGKLHISWWPDGPVGESKSSWFKSIPGGGSPSYRHDAASSLSSRTSARLEIGYALNRGESYPHAFDVQSRGGSPLYKPLAGQKRYEEEGELAYWGQKAGVKVELPGLGATDAHWGLSQHHINLWWTKFLRSKPHFRGISKQHNCASVVLQALCEGGAAAVRPVPLIKVYVEPAQIDGYAKALQQELNRLNGLTAGVVRAVARAGIVALPPPAELKDGLWTVASWQEKTRAARDLERETFRALEKALTAYQGGSWFARFTQRYGAILKMIDVIAHYGVVGGTDTLPLMLAHQILHVRQTHMVPESYPLHW